MSEKSSIIPAEAGWSMLASSCMALHTSMSFKETLELLRSIGVKSWTLMGDNARRHRDHVVVEFLESEDICWMDWSARSPDQSMPGTWKPLR
ncbi:hypothetical protein TNCV_1092251 [Trichonephila clavipes]|nr:hypothetical protein TNCV_1092251 [Trichonephila clavipes]